MRLLECAVWALTILLLIPSVAFIWECVIALLPWPSRLEDDGAAPPFVVLVPAHNEEVALPQVLTPLQAQLGPRDQILVVADNCTDRTAEVARAAGVRVVERNDPNRRGKGFALECGIQELRAAPPEVVIIVDADTQVVAGSLVTLAAAAHRHARPAQAKNLCNLGPAADFRGAISSVAIHFKNEIRPLGLHRLGFPCLLMGSGMAFPWKIASQAPWGTSHVTEDIKLGMDLACLGLPPRFCPQATVRSHLPPPEAFSTQRTRWEHGHLQASLAETPKVLWQALRQRRLDLAILAWELSVPPLSLLVLSLTLLLPVTLVLWLIGGSPWPLVTIVCTVTAMAGLIVLGWSRFCGREVPLRTILTIPWYLVAKLPIYLRYLIKPQTQWVRTERDATRYTGQN